MVIFFTTVYVSLQGNTVCAAGYGYLFHLSPEGPSKMPLLSFSENVAHSCTRYLGTFGWKDFPAAHGTANYNCSGEQKRLFPFFEDFFFNFAPFKGLSFLLSRVLNSRAKSVMDSDVVGAIFQGLIVSGFLSSFNTVLLSSLTSPIC